MNTDEVRRALSAILAPGQVFEIRILGARRYQGSRPGTAFGFFNDPDAATKKLESFLKLIEHRCLGVYYTPNALKPEILARRPHEIDFSDSGAASDADVLERRWLLVDLDPQRLSGISASEAEFTQARLLAEKLFNHLAPFFGDPIVCRSGNGMHLMYRVELSETKELADDDKLISACLQQLAVIAPSLGVPGVDVDTTTFNAARIWKLPGTMARKGGELAEQNRVHRLSEMRYKPTSMTPIPREALVKFAQPILDKLADEAARKALPRAVPEASGYQKEQIVLSDWLSQHGVKTCKTKPWHGGTMFLLDSCPWKGHGRTAFAVQFGDGRITAGCRQAGCADRGWFDLRDVFEPGWRQKREGQPAFNREVSAERIRMEIRTILQQEVSLLQEWLKCEKT